MRGWSTTDVNGDYSTIGMLPGFYYVQASPAGFVGEYYNNATSRGTAITVKVDAGADMPNVNLSLTSTPVGSISGNVTSESGWWPVFGIEVRLYNAGWTQVASTNIYNGTGDYSFTNLAPGTYYVGTNNAPNNHIDKFYDNATSRAAATPITITGGETTPGINFILSNTGAGSISGTIFQESDGAPIAGVQIQVYDTTGSGEGSNDQWNRQLSNWGPSAR